MDALPIHEQNSLPFASTLTGLMHACGHDIHIATLLGAASVLRELAPQLAGTVKLIVRPSQEAIGGMKEIIAECAMKLRGITCAPGFHNNPNIR